MYTSNIMRLILWIVTIVWTLLAIPAKGHEEDLTELVANIKPSIVGVGTYVAVRRPPARLMGTGFIVGDGNVAVTNFHVVDTELDEEKFERLVVFIGNGRDVAYRDASLIASDRQHDLALLSFEGQALAPLELSSQVVREGLPIAFTGFPIGAVLGLYPVTHRGIVSALTPLVIPARGARELTADKIAALRNPYTVLQLDATAYPGNSGSPVFSTATGHVIGVIDRVYVKGKKEDVLRDPSAITYAIPVEFVRNLMRGR